MNRLLFLMGCAVLGCIIASAAQPTLSDQAEISIFTCDRDVNQIFTLFGHSAIRVKDPATDLDVVYNYGTFSGFEEPDFILKFLNGQLLYSVNRTTINRFLGEYHYYKRSVKEQVLNLDSLSRNEIYRFLENNILPANRNYFYDFYFDNCTTRLLEITDQHIGPLVFDLNVDTAKTYRDLLHEFLADVPWTRFGMDIVLGQMNDGAASFRDQMFLPDYLFDHLSRATYDNNELKPVVQKTMTIFEFPNVEQRPGIVTPSALLWALLIFEIILFFLVFISGDESFAHLVDRIWFALLFIVSIVFLCMWLLTNHKVCYKNWNLLWTLPWMIGTLWISKENKWFRWLGALGFVVSLLILVFWQVIPQYFHPSIVPLVLISLIKCSRMIGVIKWIDQLKKGWMTAATLILFLSATGLSQQKIDGITLVAPPRAFEKDPMIELKKVNANWVALIPFGFSYNDSPQVNFGSDRQWWGEKKEGIETSIKLAKKNGLKVMLKPQVYIPGSWVGDVDFEEEKDWKIWEGSYREYIMFYVNIAKKNHVELFCVGTEYRIAVKKREQFWRNLIADIDKTYDGQLVYSANWDSYDRVPFWDALDYVGLSSYFPLAEMKTPTPFYLNLKWKKIVSKLRKYSQKVDKKILFTEFGYLAVDGAAGNTWELEKTMHEMPVNENAQANAYTALFNAFWEEDFWAGGFLWKWFTGDRYPSYDYTPQNKKAQLIVAKWYEKTE